jgi:hypothetical protein
MPAAGQDGQAADSDDLSRIVDYLNTKRSSSHQRAHGLVKDLVQRREETTSRDHRQPPPSSSVGNFAEPVAADPSTTMPSRDLSIPEARRQPLLAERYHAFCHDLDLMLDSFKARVKENKPVKH